MPQWKQKLYVGDIFAAADKGAPMEATRDALVARFKEAHWYAEAGIEDLIADLEDARTLDEFDLAWSDIYDWADRDHRLWIDTIRPTPVEAGPGSTNLEHAYGSTFDLGHQIKVF